MISSAAHSILVSSITVGADRQRKELKKVDELAESIKNVGLINPIVVTKEHVLVAGERRFRAVEFLGHSHILCRYTEELSEAELELIELEENVKRSDLTWKEQVNAVARVHQIKISEDATWTFQNTADYISVSKGQVGHMLLIQNYLDEGDELVTNADGLFAARNIALRKEQRRHEAKLAEVETDLDDFFSKPVAVGSLPKAGHAPAPKEARAIEPALPLASEDSSVPYIHGDFRKWQALPYDGPKFNFLHCDFPYGVNFDKHKMGAADKFGGYEDTPEVYASCLAALSRLMKTHVSETAHLMFWLSARHEIVDMTRNALADMGWKCNPVPLIWHRSDNSGIIPDPARGPRQVFEMCVFATRGDRHIVQPISNLFPHPKTKEVHASEKPIPMLQHFFRMFVDDSTVMLDPTMGSGNAILAAEEAGAKFVLGFEAKEEHYKNAVAYRKRVKART